MVTVAFGTDAPVVSFTEPRIVPVGNCARDTKVTEMTRNSVAAMKNFALHTPPHPNLPMLMPPEIKSFACENSLLFYSIRLRYAVSGAAVHPIHLRKDGNHACI